VIVPFQPIQPPAQQLAGVPACVSSQLRANANNLQGATGSRLGGILLRNVGLTPCVLRAPLQVVRLDRSGRKLAFASLYGREGLGYRALRIDPRQAAVAEIQLMNACGTTPSELWLDRPRVDLGIPPLGRCDYPTGPPSAFVAHLDRLVTRHPAHVLRVVSIKAPRKVVGGTTLDYTVTIANPTARTWHGTALYGEQLVDYAANLAETRQSDLPVRTLPPHSRRTFEMRIRAPRKRDRLAEVQWSLIDYTEPIPPTAPLDVLLDYRGLATYSWSYADLAIT
jgi:hypothetical protein